LPSSDNVDVKMGNGFAPVVTIVDYDPEPVVESFRMGYLRGNKKQSPDGFNVILLSFPDPGDWLFGDHESVGRCLRGNVSYGNANGVFVENFGGYFPVDDFFKYSAHVLCGMIVLNLEGPGVIWMTKSSMRITKNSRRPLPP